MVSLFSYCASRVFCSVLNIPTSRLLFGRTCVPAVTLCRRQNMANNQGQRMVWVDLESGLTQAVRESHITLQQAEYEFLSFIREHTPPGLCPLAGNSVHADKKFLDKYMPQFMKHLHYRIIDVSTVKELCRRWYTDEFEQAPKKKASHRALDDIKESIRELQFYKESIFKMKTNEEEKNKKKG
ncbi:oligoribonuclease, mitochondrial [Pelobates cultripes]|uniref:Oligoribonuclease, mitochondrial n=1 Tax=Pelobates cultripes TaxID=61616 RepID=A0AAD1WRQ2_PELCU|nr:oligoribonuclease, mitochondrial [Pelobates cultripes]